MTKPTAKELHAAATQIVNKYLETCRALIPGVDDSEHLAESDSKFVMLARYVLATVKPDDDEPIIKQWWIEEVGHGSSYVRFGEDGFSLYYGNGVWLVYEPEDPDERGEETPLPSIKTRGQVRRLLAVLGVP